MEEQLPRLTQLLIQHHVKEVVDEVTCGDRKYFINLSNTPDSSDDIGLGFIKRVCFRDGSEGNQDAAQREAIHILHCHHPVPATSRIHGDSFLKCCKHNEGLRMGTEGFGEAGINSIMLEI